MWLREVAPNSWRPSEASTHRLWRRERNHLLQCTKTFTAWSYPTAERVPAGRSPGHGMACSNPPRFRGWTPSPCVHSRYTNGAVSCGLLLWIGLCHIACRLDPEQGPRADSPAKRPSGRRLWRASGRHPRRDASASPSCVWDSSRGRRVGDSLGADKDGEGRKAQRCALIPCRDCDCSR